MQNRRGIAISHLKFILILVLCCTWVVQSPVYGNQNTVKTAVDKPKAITVANENDFYKMISVAVAQQHPLYLMDQAGSNENFDAFVAQNEYEVNVVKEADINRYRETLNADAIVVLSASADQRTKMLSAQVSALFKWPLYFDDENYKSSIRPESKVYMIGDLQTEDIRNNQTVRWDEKSLEAFYKENTKDYTLAIELMDDTFSGPLISYYAALRHGVILESDETTSPQFEKLAMIGGVETLTKSAIISKYEQVRQSNQSKINGIGLLTGDTIQTLNLLVLRSWFYDIEKTGKGLLFLDAFSKDDRQSFTANGWKRTQLNGRSGTASVVKSELTHSAYVEFFAHGSPKGFLLGDGNHFDKLHVPLLNSAVWVSEACHTVDLSEHWSLPISAIKNGAVAYIGSLEIGGVTSNRLAHPYLLSNKSAPLSSIVMANNEELMQKIANIPRAVLIGDPVWYQHQNLLKENQQGYDIQMPFDWFERISLPIGTPIEGNMATFNGGESYTDVIRSNGISFVKLGSLKNTTVTVLSKNDYWMSVKQYARELKSDIAVLLTQCIVPMLCIPIAVLYGLWCYKRSYFDDNKPVDLLFYGVVSALTLLCLYGMAIEMYAYAFPLSLLILLGGLFYISLCHRHYTWKLMTWIMGIALPTLTVVTVLVENKKYVVNQVVAVTVFILVAMLLSLFIEKGLRGVVALSKKKWF